MASIYEEMQALAPKLLAIFGNPTKIDWQRKTLTPDGMGGNSEAWASMGFLNAAVLPKTTTTQPIEADRLQPEVVEVVFITYADALNITGLDRFVFSGREFAIIGNPINVGEANAVIKFICKEGLPT
jgi:head-tail adaptor